MPNKSKEVVCIDLDGTLVRSDTFLESFAVLLREAPWTLIFLPFWLLGGRANLKSKIARRAKLNIALLPYNDEVLDYIKERKRRGAEVVLATAADQSIADAVAVHLGGFDQVLASDGGRNLKGRKKARLLIDRYGEGGFDYLGNSNSDLAVWEHSKGKVLVGSSRSCADRLRGNGLDFEWLDKGSSAFSTILLFLRAIRVQQWVKNLLLFIPLLMAHQWLDPIKLKALLCAFVAFGCAASSVYLVNDLVDLENDRTHRYKRIRPFASGRLSLLVAIIGSPILLLLAVLLAALISKLFLGTLVLYYLVCSLYSFWLKKLALLDIIVLAVLYTIRVLAGGYAADVEMSPWLLAFALFWFLSLACVKRFSELLAVVDGKQAEAKGRGYLARDLNSIGVFGIVAGYMSILVVALYLQSAEVLKLYERSMWLWLACPVLLYWISRVWLLAQRGEIREDPILFAITDRVSYIVLGLGILVMMAAM